MTDKILSEEILDKIKDIKPKPRWEFLLKNYVIWVLGLISLILGSLSFATVLYIMINNDWDVHQQIAGSMPKFILVTMPYFWLIFLGLFILAAYLNFRYTKKGYKFPLSKVILGSVALSVLFGSIFYSVGLGKIIDNALSERAPFYRDFINPRHHIWANTDDGFLAGVIVSIDDDILVIDDVKHNIWYVSNFEKSLPPVLPPGFVVEVGVPLRIIGDPIDSQYFEAEMILPMRGMNWMDGRPLPPDIGERKIKGIRIIR